jgi:hypothetical protein
VKGSDDAIVADVRASGGSGHLPLDFHGVKTIEGSILRRRNERDHELTVSGRVGTSPLVSLKWSWKWLCRSSNEILSPLARALAGMALLLRDISSVR